VTNGEVRGAPTVEQSEAADHNGESSTYCAGSAGASKVPSKIGYVQIQQ
jgi:hypothetical protein